MKLKLARNHSLLFALIAAVVSLGIGPWPALISRARTRRAENAPRQAAKEPFRVGERLFYQIGWMNLPAAATAELKVEPRRDFYGDPVWHFQAVTETENPLRMVMAVNDQFDSYCDAATLATRQYEMYLDEMDKRSVRKLALDDGSPGAEKIEAPEGTRDPLAMLYRLRLVNWQHTPQFSSHVYDGTHFYRVVARLVSAQDSVTVPAGEFSASQIAIRIVPDSPGAQPMQITLWLANNPARLPSEPPCPRSSGSSSLEASCSFLSTCRSCSVSPRSRPDFGTLRAASRPWF